jgi:hypothetical protein
LVNNNVPSALFPVVVKLVNEVDVGEIAVIVVDVSLSLVVIQKTDPAGIVVAPV